ncbi:signal peptidase I [Leptospira sp. 2 VSF19]|uniref:Signal peptidase I n=1 Tax=Leptospira soteropolitanensis TaxID=2950025 RepID=A0AAW5VL34_9LEPT|nr:signal peptidase I [Leptospira soteropolitanensis]MCW7493109.1 signal peptidase I [Leptospira soteropolitanensis]MCW7500822.1 signal peptidase I [Leptospira soteropolitanensis]MCW7522959.1 signal peptidase I [Leptospira soteropolitanensis]MCW7526934.1 signal peptidase I [Leptospira soteropolitanensis]MCW7530677.1 signal peptidase I [Leptospira soteropolitanensis]
MSKSKNKIPFKTRLVAFAIPLVVGLLAAVVFKYFVITPVHIPNQFMEPTLKNGSTAYFNRLFRFKHLGIGDIVLVRSPLDPKSLLIARIVGKPGDTIYVEKRMVFRNGTLLDPTSFPESSSNDIPMIPPGKTESDDMAKVTVPDKSFFLLADNRELGVDSRTLGVVQESHVIATLW